MEKLTLIFTWTLICQNHCEREDPSASLLLDPRELCRMPQVGGLSGAAPAPRQDSPNACLATSTPCSYRKEPHLKCSATPGHADFHGHSSLELSGMGFVFPKAEKRSLLRDPSTALPGKGGLSKSHRLTPPGAAPSVAAKVASVICVANWSPGSM